MLESNIEQELTAGWEVVPDGIAAVTPSDDDEFSPTATTVATHEDGVSIVLEHVAGYPALDATWYVGFDRPLESNGWRVRPTTHEAFFEDDGTLLAYINERAGAVSEGSESFTAFAIVPHDGSTPSVITPDGALPRPDQIDGKPAFADVFTVRDSALEDSDGSLNTLRDARVDLVSAVFGLSDDVPDALSTVSSPQQAHSETTIEVFTVTDPAAIDSSTVVEQ